MRRFQFSLQAALVLRERGVESAERALRTVQFEWNENRRQSERIAEEIRTAEEAVCGGAVNPADFVALDRYRAAAQRQRMRIEQEAKDIAQRIAERQTALLWAERDRTLLVRLREKALQRWQAEFDKEQQALAEEAYLSRWGR